MNMKMHRAECIASHDGKMSYLANIANVESGRELQSVLCHHANELENCIEMSVETQ